MRAEKKKAIDTMTLSEKVIERERKILLFQLILSTTGFICGIVGIAVLVIGKVFLS